MAWEIMLQGGKTRANIRKKRLTKDVVTKIMGHQCDVLGRLKPVVLALCESLRKKGTHPASRTDFERKPRDKPLTLRPSMVPRASGRFSLGSC
jgi:hypothetical protein